MSRGGRGGRGRGRFGKGSVAQDLIRDNLEDLGLDVFHGMDDRGPRQLFPNINLPVFQDYTEEDYLAIDVAKRIKEKLEERGYNMKRKAADEDNSLNSTALESKSFPAVRAHIKSSLAGRISMFIPNELLEEKNSLKPTLKKKKKAINLQELDQDDVKEGAKPNEEGSDEENEKEESGEEEEEDDNDYVADYYNSDNEGYGDDGDGDAEATF